MQVASPSELLPGDDGVVLGERFAADGGFYFGQQAAGAAVLARFCSRAELDAGPASGVPGARTFGDHGVG